MNGRYVDSRAAVGRGLGLSGALCAIVGTFVLNGISIEFPGIVLGALGYYFCLTSGDGAGQTLGILAAALNVISMGISGIENPQPWLTSHGVERS